MIGKLWGGPADGLAVESTRPVIFVVVVDGQATVVDGPHITGPRGASQYWRRCHATTVWEWVPTYPREPFEGGFTPPERPPGACGHPRGA